LKNAFESDSAGEEREMALKGVRRYLQDKMEEEMKKMKERLEREKIEREIELVRSFFTSYYSGFFPLTYIFNSLFPRVKYTKSQFHSTDREKYYICVHSTDNIYIKNSRYWPGSLR
jgi:hypothetical protein